MVVDSTPGVDAVTRHWEPDLSAARGLLNGMALGLSFYAALFMLFWAW